MTSCVATDQDGFLYLSMESIETCSQLVVLSADEYNYLTSHTSITGAEVVEFYSFGFALVFFGWIISFPIKAVLKAVKLI
ncbi:hypothetical protein J4N42_18210 [Vibrio sp. SCSIO 43135]|uniref:hypothetical protein n=1 Tax=Vibrio sp. SCSIO 43135 TaxID=2819096 RepID=UPI0020763340|nr:hypothetical protein [Vibrio sp. SCSIO 43135]USD44060.1 hypothetical protein J4N42_18120 [Vibrio sp. SCSIO 43135]USD44069.1 hypothetical protein J4N42_18165 [Vibrio sp. SCSIO 43135]USD44078.1 hypothetical protein J4N42_18210 [Vibrio sp. SCSIO 43135]